MGITQHNAKIQSTVNGMISMIVIAEMFQMEALVVLELKFYSIREEIDHVKNFSYKLFISFLFSDFGGKIVFEFTSTVLQFVLDH